MNYISRPAARHAPGHGICLMHVAHYLGQLRETALAACLPADAFL